MLQGNDNNEIREDSGGCSPTSGSTGHLFGVALDLKMSASCWVGDARLIGNIKASDLVAMARDYTTLRLIAGISDTARPHEDKELAGDAFEKGWKAAIESIKKGLSEPEVKDDLLGFLSK